MLSAEALRLAAIEVLRPTSAVEAGAGYPTLAGLNVLDSRAIAVEDIDRDQAYTPILALYTADAGVSLRGPHASAWDTVADAVLDVVAELGVVESDKDGEFADALASTDPDARLVLATLCSQVRYLLEQSQAGGLWRHLVRQIVKIEYQPFSVPNIGIRWQRITMRFHCEIHDDDFDTVGLPEPMGSLFAALPSQSYAKAKLATLATHFSRDALRQLEGVDGTTGSRSPGFKVDFP
jgi:hypothetical protein